MAADYCYKFQGDGNTCSVIKAQENSPGPLLSPSRLPVGFMSALNKGHLKQREEIGQKIELFIFETLQVINICI